MKSSIHQLAVLEWLWRWPGLTISGGRRPRFNGAWASTADRHHMEQTIVWLNGGEGTAVALDATRPAYLTAEATPDFTRRTFEALLVRGYVEATRPSPYRQGEHVYGLSAVGLTAYMQQRRAVRGQQPRTLNDVRTNPRRPGVVEIRRRGGVPQARSALRWHREQEAEHRRIADHLEESLRLYEEHVVEQQAAWRARRVPPREA